jgi:DNA-binding IclR family transcriptional regulator
MAISEATGLPNSTAHRLLHTLYALGYTEWRESNSSPYKLTMRLFEYGMSSVEKRSFIQAARPLLDRLSEGVNYPACILVPDRGDAICVLQSTKSSFANGLRLGMRVPMWCSAPGKCILASYNKKKLLSIWENREVRNSGPNAPASFEKLIADVQFVQEHGYFCSGEEFRMGLSCLSVPLKDAHGSVIGALCVCHSPSMLSEAQVESLKGHLHQYGERLAPMLYEMASTEALK